MAEQIGADAVCDICGEACDANTQELNVLSCTFKNCQDLPYHQDCLEKYLKSIRLERNRKTGFKCPRGCGKGTAFKDACPGKIDKSHPIHPRNEEQKKKKKAKLPEPVAPPVRTVKHKEEKQAEKVAAVLAPKAAASAAAANNKAAKAVAGNCKPPAAAAVAAATATAAKARPPPPPDSKVKIAEALAAARREIAGVRIKDQGPQQPAVPAAPEYKTLDMYYKENAAAAASTSSLSSIGSVAPAAAPVANAWAKPPTPSAAAMQAKAAQHKADLARLQVGDAAQAGQHAHLRALSPSAKAAAAAQPPPPPPPPPANDRHHAAAAALQASFLQPQASNASLLSQHSVGGVTGVTPAGPCGPLPVGAEYISEEEQQHLTKAQRKNLKRAEKKKKGGQGDAGAGAADTDAAVAAAAAVLVADHAGPGFSSTNAAGLGSYGSDAAGLPAAAAVAAGTVQEAGVCAARDGLSTAGQQHEEDNSLIYELALQALLANKTLALVASLQRLGFAEWQAAAAIQRHGSNLEDAVAWLLEGGAPDPAAAATVSSGCVALVSISQELAMLEALAAALPQIPQSLLYQTVADAGGDLDAAAAVLLQHLAMTADADAAIATSGDSAAAVQAAAAGQHTALSSHARYSLGYGSAASAGVFANGDSIFGGSNASSSNGNDRFGVYTAEPATATAPFTPISQESAGVSLCCWLNDSDTSNATPATAATAVRAAQGGAPTPGREAAGSTSVFAFTDTTWQGTVLAASSGLNRGLSQNGSIWAPQGSNSATAATGSGWPPASVNLGLNGLQDIAIAKTSSLFGNTTSSSLGLGGFGGHQQQQQQGYGSIGLQQGFGLLSSQQSLSAADPVLETFGSGSVLGHGAENGGLLFSPVAQGPDAAAGAANAGASAGLQQSRLFSAYGWRQQPLFGQQQDQQEQQAEQRDGLGAAAIAEVDEAELEGLMATLMCH